MTENLTLDKKIEYDNLSKSFYNDILDIYKNKHQDEDDADTVLFHELKYDQLPKQVKDKISYEEWTSGIKEGDMEKLFDFSKDEIFSMGCTTIADIKKDLEIAKNLDLYSYDDKDDLFRSEKRSSVHTMILVHYVNVGSKSVIDANKVINDYKRQLNSQLNLPDYCGSLVIPVRNEPTSIRVIDLRD